MIFDRLERSPLKLVRKTYFQVKYKGNTHFLVEKCFASKYDGLIETIEITKQEYLKAFHKGETVKVLDYAILDKYMKRSVKKAIGIENYKEED